VAETQPDTFWFGILGLGFQPTNFSDYVNPQVSFSDTLVSNDSISSMSWSYTAGAYYRLKGIFGSLIFGGYDASRFTPNDLVFTMTGGNLRDIVLMFARLRQQHLPGIRHCHPHRSRLSLILQSQIFGSLSARVRRLRKPLVYSLTMLLAVTWSMHQHILTWFQ
jgi:hypothetical protein